MNQWPSGRKIFDEKPRVRKSRVTIPVLDPGKGVCADPVNGSAILGKGGPDPQSGDRERQLTPDKGRGKT